MMPSTRPGTRPPVLGFPLFSAVLCILSSLKYSVTATQNGFKHIVFGSSRGQTSPMAGVFAQIKMNASNSELPEARGNDRV